MNRSRLSRRSEERTKNQITRLFIVLVILILILLFFGAQIIGFVGNIIFNIRGANNQTQKIVSKDYLEPPFVDPLPQATPSAAIKVAGLTQYRDSQLEIFVNDTSYKNVAVGKDGKFEQESVILKEGANTIKVRVKQNNKTSDFSNPQIIIYTKNPPKLDISSPNDGQQFQKADQNITVSGKTDPDSIVTVNGYRSIVNDDGSFSYYLPLKGGDNEITIRATSATGAQIEKKLKVNYQP